MREAEVTPESTDTDRGSKSLSIAALVFVALAAIMGWGASFVGLHEYGMQSMAGFDYWTAWLVPATFDGAAFACTLVTYRSSINGRSAVRGRVLMWGFTAISSWINWIHQPTPEAQIVAAGLPIAAVAVFDVVLLELRADFEARHGRRGFRLRPGLLLLRWMVDRESTRSAFRRQIMDIPVEDLAGLKPLNPGDPAGRKAGSDEDEPTTRRPEQRSLPVGTRRAETSTARQPRPESVTGPESTPVADRADVRDETSPPADRTERSESVRWHTDDRVERDDRDGERSGAAESREWADSEPVQPEPVESDRPAEDHPTPMEQTMALPPVPAHGLQDDDRRAAARRDYRASLEIGQPVSGAQLGKRYGLSERWGRNQIAAAREEMRREQDPRLVGADR